MRPGAIAFVQIGKLSQEVATRDAQSLDCLQRVLGRVLELVLPYSFLRFTPFGRRRKHRVALRWASRRNGRIRNSSTGCHGGDNYRCSNRRVADRCRHSFACLPRSKLKSKIVAARICVLPWSLTQCFLPSDARCHLCDPQEYGRCNAPASGIAGDRIGPGFAEMRLMPILISG